MSNNAVKRIISKDIKELKNLKLEEQGIYIEFDEDNILEAKAIIIGPKNITLKINVTFLVTLSTAIAHLMGVPNHDSMAGKYYARFEVKHEDSSDSYLRKAYRNMDLHTDGTYVKEVTDWLIMTKIDEQNVLGGETAMLHLDDWEHCDDLFNNPVGKQNFTWGSPKSKNIDYKVEHPIFSSDEKSRPKISYIDQLPEPKIWNREIFYKSYQIVWKKVKIKLSLSCLLEVLLLRTITFGCMQENHSKKIRS